MTAATTERPIADRVEDELILADRQAHHLYGPRDSEWTQQQRADYFAALATARQYGEAA